MGWNRYRLFVTATLFFLVSLLLLATSCGGSAYAPSSPQPTPLIPKPEPPAPAPASTPLVEKKTPQAISKYVNDKYHYYLEYPQSWFINEIEKRMVYIYDNSDTKNWCYIVINALEADKTIYQLADESISPNLKNSYYFELISNGVTEHNGYPAIQTEYILQGSKDFPRGCVKIISILKDKIIYSIICASSTIDFYIANKANFNAIFNSFELINRTNLEKTASPSTEVKISQAKQLISEGDALLAKFDYTGALKCYDACIALEPNNSIAWCRKGDTLYKQGLAQNSRFLFSQAVDCYVQAISLDGNNYKAWYGWGSSLQRKDPHWDTTQIMKRAEFLEQQFKGQY